VLLLESSLAALALSFVLFRLATGVFVCPLCGTRDRNHDESCPWRERGS
jgi:hypothetical protein